MFSFLFMDYTTLGDEFLNKALNRLKISFIPSGDNKFQPKFLQSKFLLYFAILILLAKLFSISLFISFPRNIFFADITKSSLVKLVNQERLSSGLRLLSESKKLDKAAYLKAKDILEKDYFAHRSPDGLDPWYWFSEAGYNYKYAGENLAIGYLESEDVYKAWFESPSHRNNIVNPLYEEVGTAVMTGNFQGNTVTLVVQVFGSEKKAVKEAPKPIASNIENINIPPEEKAIPEKEIPLENIESGEVLSQSKPQPQYQYQEAKEEEKSAFYYNFLNFMFYDLEKILEYISYPLIILVSTALLLNTLIYINIQDKKIILRSLIIIVILLTTVLLDNNVIYQIIPKSVIIQSV